MRERERQRAGVGESDIGACETEGEGGGGRNWSRVRSICENEICAFDLRVGAAVGSIMDTAMKK